MKRQHSPHYWISLRVNMAQAGRNAKKQNSKQRREPRQIICLCTKESWILQSAAFSNWDTKARSEWKYINKPNSALSRPLISRLSRWKHDDKRLACAWSCPRSARTLSQHSLPNRVQPEDTDKGSRESANSRPLRADSSYWCHKHRNTRRDMGFVFWGARFS